VVCRLRAVLVELIPAGVPKVIRTARAARVLRSIRPEDAVQGTRCELAEAFRDDLRRIDAHLRETRKKLAAAVAAAGTKPERAVGGRPGHRRHYRRRPRRVPLPRPGPLRRLQLNGLQEGFGLDRRPSAEATGPQIRISWRIPDELCQAVTSLQAGHGRSGLRDRPTDLERTAHRLIISASSTHRPTGRVGVGVTFRPYGKRPRRSCQTSWILNTFFRQLAPARSQDRGPCLGGCLGIVRFTTRTARIQGISRDRWLHTPLSPRMVWVRVPRE
jgi:hypothetical protein